MFKHTESIEVRTRDRYFDRAGPACRGKPPDKGISAFSSNSLPIINNKPVKGEIYKGETIMEATSHNNLFFRRTALASLALLAVMAIATPKSAHAVVSSAGAIIHNPVTVKFTSGSQTLYNTAVVNITVATLATVPTVYKAANQTVSPGAAVTYNTYEIRSNSNGPDTYTYGGLSIDVVTGSATPATSPAITASSSLWGGYIMAVGGAGSNQIKIPAGAESGITAGTTTVEILIGVTQRRYTVSAITVVGTPRTTTPPASPGTSPVATTAETYTTLTLTPIGHAIAADTAAVGTQAGEYKTFTISFTAGTPTVAGTDGEYDNSFTITTTAKLADNTTSAVYTEGATKVRTTVSSPKLNITKKSRNITKAEAAFVSSGTTAKPGEVLEYEITVTNSHASADATNVSISDAIPVDYVTALAAPYGASNDVEIITVYNGGAPATTYATFATGDTDTAALIANTLNVTLGNGAGDANNATANGGTLKKTPDNAVIHYRVTVK